MAYRHLPTRIAIFASGTGSNAARIIEYFKDHPAIEVALVISNREGAGVLDIAERAGIPSRVIRKAAFADEDLVMSLLEEFRIDFIALAGFLLLVPKYLIRRYPHRIVNIHPALLPKYGGKGMYGMHVHEAVKAAGDKESGMTIHFVNERYDEGAIVLQRRTPIDPDDTPSDIARKVLKLEHAYFAPAIEGCIKLAQLSEEEE